MEKWVAFLSHCRVTNKAVLFCFLAWDCEHFKKEQRPFQRMQSLCSGTPPGGRHLQSSLPSPAKGENKNTAGLKRPRSMEAPTCWRHSCVLKPDVKTPPKMELTADIFTLVIGRKQKRSIFCWNEALWAPGASPDGRSLSRSCGDSRNQGNHQSWEENSTNLKVKSSPTKELHGISILTETL